LRDPRSAGTDDVALLGSRVPLHERRECRAGLRIVNAAESDEEGLEVDAPETALATLVQFLARDPLSDQWWSPDEVVARFGEIARFSRIHRDARIGEGTRIGAGVVVHAGVRVGARCTLCDHAVLGSPGFGLHRPSAQPEPRPLEAPVPVVEPGPVVEPVETTPAGRIRSSPASTTATLLLPHRAGVQVGDDVFLGPHVNVAAGLIEPTWIGRHARIDALVQIGHNCRVGEECILAGQVGLAGSVELGAGCLVGGQAGFADHVRLGNGCRVAGQAGVTRSWPDRTDLVGFPARPRGAWLRDHAHSVPAPRTHSSTFSPNVGT